MRIAMLHRGRLGGRRTSVRRVMGCLLWAVVIGLLLFPSGPAEVNLPASDAAEAHGEHAGEARRKAADVDAVSAQPQPPTQARSPIEEHQFEKLLPDLKVPLNSPPTAIELAGLFEGTELGRRCGPGGLVVRVERVEKPKVVTAELQADKLILHWGSVGKGSITLRAHPKDDPSSVLDSKFSVEVWKPEYSTLILTTIGGLGIFLLGMKSMSEGLQAVAGAGLRRMIRAVTENRLMAVGVGTLVTCLIQSSSITTVMVVGFVNSGFMTLAQAIGVIMGANIGTTITGWILALKIGKYGLPILGTAAFVYLFTRRDRLRFLAMATMGLGMVFFGLELMKDGFAIVKDLPTFEAWFKSFEANSYSGVLRCAAVGCTVTLIVQSSSATLGITIGLAVTEVISIPTACALVLGENIGTTITALLASLGTTRNARRAAYFHAFFNVLGVTWITAVFIHFYLPFITWLVPFLATVLPGIEVGPEAMIATTHTVFNVTNTLLFLPFVRKIAAVLERLGGRPDRPEKPHLTSLDVRMLETSAIAVEQSRVELLRMASGCEKLAGWVKEVLSQEVPDRKTVQQAFHREETLDQVQDEIVAFIAHVLAHNVPLETAEEARRQLRMADEYESISDYLIVILKSHLSLEKSGLRLPGDDAQAILQLHDMVAEYLAMVNRGYERRDPDLLSWARTEGAAVTRHIKDLRSRFLAQMSENKMAPQVIVAFNAQLNAYRRVREHALNVAEAIAGEK